MNASYTAADYGRDFNQARKDQGFASQAHLDAFYATVDHKAGCAECQRPTWYWNGGDASWQPATAQCETGAALSCAARCEDFEVPR